MLRPRSSGFILYLIRVLRRRQRVIKKKAIANIWDMNNTESAMPLMIVRGEIIKEHEQKESRYSA